MQEAEEDYLPCLYKLLLIKKCIWALALRKEQRLRVFENRAVREYLHAKREQYEVEANSITVS
jgi:hypothetical protein